MGSIDSLYDDLIVMFSNKKRFSNKKKKKRKRNEKVK